MGKYSILFYSMSADGWMSEAVHQSGKQWVSVWLCVGTVPQTEAWSPHQSSRTHSWTSRTGTQILLTPSSLSVLSSKHHTSFSPSNPDSCFSFISSQQPCVIKSHKFSLFLLSQSHWMVTVRKYCLFKWISEY